MYCASHSRSEHHKFGASALAFRYAAVMIVAANADAVRQAADHLCLTVLGDFPAFRLFPLAVSSVVGEVLLHNIGNPCDRVAASLQQPHLPVWVAGCAWCLVNGAMIGCDAGEEER
jgi:hypothetical protein